MAWSVLFPVVQNQMGATARLTLKQDAGIQPGLSRDPGMAGTFFPDDPPGRGFNATAQLAYRVALNYLGLSPGLSLTWSISPAIGGNFLSLKGDSAGGAFLALLEKVASETSLSCPECQRNESKRAAAVVALDKVAVTATIDLSGEFKNVSHLREKLDGLLKESDTTGLRMAVISSRQPRNLGPHLEKFKCQFDLYRYKSPLYKSSLPVLKASDAPDCFKTLLRMQSQQVMP